MGTNAGKVFMQFDDGTSGWVPARNVLAAKRDGGKIANIRMRSPYGQERDINGASAGRMLDMGAEVVEPGNEQQGRGVLPAMGRATQTAVAGIPGAAAQMAPMMIPGNGWGAVGKRLLTAFGAGTAADASSRAIMGEQQDPLGSATMGGLNAAWQAPFEAASAVIPHLPRQFMKSAFGNSRPGVEDIALNRKQVVSNEGRADRAAEIKADTHSADYMVASSKAKFDWTLLDKVMKAKVGAAKAGDAISSAAEEALTKAREHLAAKYGPQKPVGATVETSWDQPYRSNYQGKDYWRNYEPEQPMRFRAKKLSAQEMDDVRAFADDQVRTLREARAGDKTSKPGAMESAYLDLSNAATRFLRDAIPKLKETRMRVSEDITLNKAVGAALKRASQKPTNPMAAIMHLGQSPEGLSRAAINLSNPAIPGAMRNVPRVLGVAAADALNRGNR